MTELAHIHRTVDGVAEIDVVGDGLFGGRTAVTVAGVHQLIVVGAVVQHPEKAVPVGTAQQDDVVFIYLSDGLYSLFIYRLQQLVERVAVLEIVGDGLVHQFVAQNGGLAAIAIGYLAPDIAELLLALLTFEQPGVTVSVVDVIARLSAWTVVHIQNQIQVVGLAPGDDRVDACVAILLACLSHVILVAEQLVVERQTNGVGTLIGNEVDILTCHVVILELLPELGSGVGTHGLFHHQVDHPRRVGTSETEHVTLGVQPVAQVCALNQEFLTVGLDEVVAVDGDEPIGIVLLAHVAGHQQERKEINECFLHCFVMICLFWMYIPFLLGCCTFRPCRS